jgi:hypothetical protein
MPFVVANCWVFFVTFAGAAAGMQTRLQTQPASCLDPPPGIAKRTTAAQAFPQALHLGFGLQFVDVLQPALRPRHRARVQGRLSALR